MTGHRSNMLLHQAATNASLPTRKLIWGRRDLMSRARSKHAERQEERERERERGGGEVGRFYRLCGDYCRKVRSANNSRLAARAAELFHILLHFMHNIFRLPRIPITERLLLVRWESARRRSMNRHTHTHTDTHTRWSTKADRCKVMPQRC